MGRVLIWSDLHLGHSKIIEYENRPFTDVYEMDKELLDNWRTFVKKDDTLINLGDLSMYINKERMIKLLANLPGKKILIIGNHDRSKPVKWWYEVGFDEVYKHPYVYCDRFILSHKPLEGDLGGFLNIHGHTHSQREDDNQHRCVSVEKTGYKPLLFDDVIRSFK